MVHQLTLFLLGFFQVALVVSNTYFISKEGIAGIVVNGFLINYIWSHNVKVIAFGNEWDRVIYSSGAVLGSVVGFYGAKRLFKKSR